MNFVNKILLPFQKSQAMSTDEPERSSKIGKNAKNLNSVPLAYDVQ